MQHGMIWNSRETKPGPGRWQCRLLVPVSIDGSEGHSDGRWASKAASIGR